MSGKSYIYQLPTAQPYAVLNSIEAAGFSGGISNLVEDTTPQLGGNLDLNSKTINGSGNISYTGNFLNSGFHQTNLLSGNSFTILGSTDNNTLSIGHSGNISLNQSGSGSITFFNAYSFPTSDGTEGTVLTTNGSGTLSWSTPSSGGISNVVEDTTPQLGGNLDANEFNIIGGTSQYDSLSLWGAENASDGAIWMAGSRYANNGTVNIAGSNSGSGGTVNINYSGNNGSAYGTTYIGGLATVSGFDNEVHIVDSKWPQARGSNGQVLTTDGAGTLSWADASGGSSFTAPLFHTLDNPNPYGTSADDNFGWSVAVSGNYAIVGAYNEDDAGSLLNSGKAYIFNVSTGALVATLDNPNAYGTSSTDNFGYSVAISGNYAIVGAYKEDDAGGNDSGKAYIFNVTTGALVYTLDNPNAYSTSSNDRFGNSVAISGNYAIVGVSYEDDAGGLNSGKAYIFNVTTGALVHTLDNPSAYSTSDIDNFGNSVAISGNYAIVGAWFEDDAGGSDSGKAYIYNVSTGALVHTLDNPNAYDTSASDNFGNSVAISGNYAIVGATWEDDGGLNSGKAYIFNVSTGALLHTLDNPNAYSTSTTDNFGNSVAISGNYAIIGARLEDDASGGNSGKAYIFDVTTGTLVATLDNSNAYSTSLDDRFGKAVTISGNYAVVGAWQEDDASGTSSGKAYIYQLPNAQPYVLDAAEAAGFSSGGGSFADRYVAAILF
jgi:hypothetical protein